MINMKHLLLLLNSFFFMSFILKAQVKSELNLRQKYVDSLDKTIGINKSELLDKLDSIVIIHYKGSVYQIQRSAEKFEIFRVLLLEKETGKKGGKEVFKTLMKTDTFFLIGADTNKVINTKVFDVLFDLSNAPGDKTVLKYKNSPTNAPTMLDLYIESIGKGRYRFQELPPFFIDDIECNGKKLDQFLKDLFREFSHWEAIENMVKKSGYGVYKFSNRDLGFRFEYKPNKKYKVEGYPKELVKMPRL